MLTAKGASHFSVNELALACDFVLRYITLDPTSINQDYVHEQT
jgi:outer membrane protein assembly factor BamD (BamD/ComL family)